MNGKNIFLGLVLLAFVSCKTPVNLTLVSPQKNQVVGQDIELKKEFVDVINPYKQRLDAAMNKHISYTEKELGRRGDNSLLGQLLVDFVLEGANEWGAKNGIDKVNSAILNIGGIRKDIDKGSISVKDIYEVMPFENELVIVKMKGEDIQGVFEYYEKSQRNNPVAGFRIKIENEKLVEGLINGEKPQKEKTYYIATSDYLAQGGDYMKFFSRGEMIKTEISLRELFLEKFRQNPEIKITPENRLEFVKLTK